MKPYHKVCVFYITILNLFWILCVFYDDVAQLIPKKCKCAGECARLYIQIHNYDYILLNTSNSIDVR